MTLKNIISLLSLIIALLLSSGITHIAQAKNTEDFTNVFIFGDSFSTKGSWADVISTRYGFGYTQNKSGFAVGGATVDDLPNQLANYNAANAHHDSNALYIIFMGPSDFAASANNYYTAETILAAYVASGGDHLAFAQLANQLNSGALTFATAFPQTLADIEYRATNISNFIQMLNTGGSKYIVALNYFNNSLRDNGNFANYEYFFDGIWTSQYNKALYNKIQTLAPSANVILVDQNRLLSEVTSSPAKFFVARDIGGTFNNNGFFDLYAHPTTAGHKILAQYVASIIESPSRVAVVREIPLSTGDAIFQSTRDLATQISYQPLMQTISYNIVADYSNINSIAFSRKQLGFKTSNVTTGAISVNYHLQEHLNIGAKLNINKNKMDFVYNYGKATVNECLLSLYGIYSFEKPIFIYGNLGGGNLGYVIDRRIPLGQGAHSERGKPTGTHYLAMIGTGYRIPLDEEINLIPYISSNYQSVSMKSYQERGVIKSTTMFFNIPKRESFTTEIGATIERKRNIIDNITLASAATMSYSYDFKDPLKQQIQSRVSDMPRNFVVPSYKVDNSKLYLQGNIDAIIKNKFSIGVHTVIKPLGSLKQWSVGLSAAVKI